jgi:hypothetical protein
VEEIMPKKKSDLVGKNLLSKPNPQAPHEAADRIARKQRTGPRLATIDTVAGGTVAVTRPGMPWLFRVLLALTGVRV